MEAPHRVPYLQNLYDHAWIEYGYHGPGVLHAKPSNMRNQIHPIFSYRKPEPAPGQSNTLRWSTTTSFLSREHWDIMAPTLCLASQVLLCPASIKFLYSVIFGRRENSGHVFQGLPVPRINKTIVMDSTARPLVEAALIEMARTISFRFSSADSLWLNNAQGLTRCSLLYRSAGIRIHKDTSKGVASIIAIDERYMQYLTRPATTTLTHYTEPSRIRKVLNLQFRLMITICHEIAHAVGFACNEAVLGPLLRGDHIIPSNEPFIGQERLAELGFSWENSVFGGTIGQGTNPPFDLLNDTLWIEGWPSFHHWQSAIRPSVGHPDLYSTRYLISTHYIQNIQTEEFWEEVGVSAYALRIKKALGIRFKRAGNFGNPYPGGSGMQPDEICDPTTGRVLRDHAFPDLASERANESGEEKIRRLTIENQRLNMQGEAEMDAIAASFR